MSDEILYAEESEFYRVRLLRTDGRYSALVEDQGSPGYVHEARRKEEAHEFFLAEVGRLRRKYGMPGEEKA